MITVFLREKVLDKEILKEYLFYYGDLSNIDISTDWRFKHYEMKMLGTSLDLLFPIVYPFQTSLYTLDKIENDEQND